MCRLGAGPSPSLGMRSAAFQSLCDVSLCHLWVTELYSSG